MLAPLILPSVAAHPLKIVNGKGGGRSLSEGIEFTVSGIKCLPTGENDFCSEVT